MLDQLSGQYQSLVVNGLTTTLNLQTAGADMLTMPEPARVTIAAVQTGVEVTDCLWICSSAGHLPLPYSG